MKKIRFDVKNKQQNIYGELNIPDGTGPFPLVIYSHGYGYNFSLINLDHLTNQGIATYFFDFGGGSPQSRSDGDSLNMSVITETEELIAIISSLKKVKEINESKIYLTGNSQGGVVSTLAGIKDQQDIQGMILLCPAYVIFDHSKKYFKNPFRKKEFRFGNMKLSEKYYTDIRDLDIFQEISNFKKPTIIIHGNRDMMVPLKYAKQAQNNFPNSKLIVVKNAGHMLSGHSKTIEEEILNLIK